jgi:putative addiction module killer protein
MYSIEYNLGMFQVQTTEAFDAWLAGLRDGLTRKRLALRLRKAELGNLGDVKPVGGGVWEMREFFGPGWRMYYLQQGAVLVVMLGGGDKSTQPEDIAAAAALAQQFQE